MGWSFGILNGKRVGYSVKAKCEHPECNEDINRGLIYVCGGMHGGGGIGCGRYFCDEHLVYIHSKLEGRTVQVCEECYDLCMELPEVYEDPIIKAFESLGIKCRS